MTPGNEIGGTTPGDETRGATPGDETGGTTTTHAARARDDETAIPRADRRGDGRAPSFADATDHRKWAPGATGCPRA